MYGGQHIELGPIERAHLDRWREWVNDSEIASLLDRVLPVTSDEHERFFERAVVNNRNAVWFAITRSSDLAYVGNVWLWNINERHRSAEVRILIGDKSAWGSGIGSEALSLIGKYAGDSLGLHKLYAYVMERNSRARAAFERAGYTVEALLKEEYFWDGHFTNAWRLGAITGEASAPQ